MKRLASAITVALLAFSMTVSYAETVPPTKIEGIWTNRDNEVCDINVIDPGNQQDPVLV